MKYELYIDLFFLENVVTDSILLFALNRIHGYRRKPGRIFLVSAAAGVLTCAAFVLRIPPVLRLIYFHIFVNSFMIKAGLDIKKFTDFVRSYLLLYLCSVFLGGIIRIFRPWLKYAVLFYIAAAAGYFALIMTWRFISLLAGRKESIFEVTLYGKEKECTVRALLDTGNCLTDPVTGLPVSILSGEKVRQIWPDWKEMRGFRCIAYRHIGGEGVICVFRADKMCVHTKEERWVESPLIGVGESTLSGSEEYEMILNPGVFSQ